MTDENSPKVLLVLINPQNGIYRKGALADADLGKKHIPRLVGLLHSAIKKSWSVALTLRMHNADDDVIRVLTPHLLRETDESRILDELRPFLRELDEAGNLHIFEAGHFDHTIDAFEKKTDITLYDTVPGDFDQVHVAGAWSSVDVLYTVMGLRAKCGQKADIVVWTDAVAGYDDESHSFAVRQMSVVLGALLADEKISLDT